MLDGYDAFLSYSSHDQRWVRDWLLPRLEARGFKVCIDVRDFAVGVPSLINIERAVKNSRRTLVVLSPAWVESEWAEFESLLAASPDPAGRRQSILPIMLQQCQIPPRIGTLSYADFTSQKNWGTELNRVADALEVKDGSLAPFSNENRVTPGRSHDVLDAYAKCIERLLMLQYPWGEWSDRRTSLESSVAERQPVRGLQGPKPNVARTIFALEALAPFLSNVLKDRFRSALEWLLDGVQDGWYLEWATSQALDSEAYLPSLIFRRDIRHSAQIVSALCRWRDERDPLDYMLRNVSISALPTGLWPESPGEAQPRILASVYSVEALGNITAGKFRMPVEDLLERSAANQIWSTFRHGLAALHEDCDLGSGLLGTTAGRANAYLTGITLFRLAPLAPDHVDIFTLVTKMVNALSRSTALEGWVDVSVPLGAQIDTLKRTTLRVAAGIAVAGIVGVEIPAEVQERARSLVKSFIGVSDPLELDSPDYACAAIVLHAADGRLPQLVNVEKLEEQARNSSRAYMPRWHREFRKYVSALSPGRELSLPGYRELAASLEEKVALLKV